MSELEVIQHSQINGISVFFDTVDYRTPHSHPELEIILILENSLVVTSEQKQMIIRPGSFLIFNPNQLHEFHKENKSCTFLCIQISPKCFTFSAPLLEQIVFDELFPENKWNAEQTMQARSFAFSLAHAYFHRQADYELYCIGMAAIIIHQMLTTLPTHRITKEEEAEQSRKNDRMQRLMAFVDENYTHKIRLSDFAEIENRSLSYLSHFIKDNINQNFQEYVNGVRFNAACKLMKESNLKSLDICMETGFSDYRYFSETFRKRTGYTPEEYRKLLPSQTEEVKIHHSIHSLELFYTREKSYELLQHYQEILNIRE